jgi:hypothetical protein
MEVNGGGGRTYNPVVSSNLHVVHGLRIQETRAFAEEYSGRRPEARLDR